MSNKRDGGRVMKTLERMGFVEKVEEQPAPRQEDYVETQTVSEFPASEITVSDDFWDNVPQKEQPVSEPVEDTLIDGQPAFDATVFDDIPEPEAPELSAVPEPPAPDKDTLTPVEELYSMYGLTVTGPQSIFLIEKYLKSIPDSLPTDVRRDAVINIIEASGFSYEALLNDGVSRLTKLADFETEFDSRTDEIVHKLDDEIAMLETQIARAKASKETRLNLHRQQRLAVDSESRRIKDIMDFIR